ncbi:hypothetical protein HPB52_006146 [Rhipicephalus sanguineus]|uniref:Uncharacterized protein n=1 Tax=Rhipicephalus sanguineus TaxID=34632 RepID=A0A9D4SQE3_RHISA|nr:hypothetical protein HPB52_006146 [Rhipicephalus sanguineus]
MDAKASATSAVATHSNVQRFVRTVRDCGVPFNVNIACPSKGRAFASLTGKDTKKLLSELPEKIRDLFYSDTREEVLFLWTTLRSLLEAFSGSDTDRDLEKDGQAFLQTFVRLGNSKRKGYGGERLTPYIHILCHHAALKHKQSKGLSKFASQGLEKKNDVLKHFYHQRSNKWDAATDALRLSKRLEDDSDETPRRPYHKTDEEYWREGGIEESRKRRERISVIPSAQEPSNVDPQVMTPGELRTELAARGVSTSSQDAKRLRQLLATIAQSELTE